MKKYIFALMCAASMLFVSCNGGTDVSQVDVNTLDNTTVKCWEVTMTVNSLTTTQFAWMTERMLVEQLQFQVNMSKQANVEMKATYKQANANTEDACEELNKKEENKAGNYCWEITMTYQGYSETSHVWGTEEQVKAAMQVAKDQAAAQGITGIEYSYTRTNAANNADDCYDLDERE